MSSSDAPKRLTKRRASMLLDVANEGLVARMDRLEDEYAVYVRKDGSVEVTEGYHLLEQGQQEALADEIEDLRAALAAYSIIYHRYVA